MGNTPENDLFAFTNVLSLGAHPTAYQWLDGAGDVTWPLPCRALRANSSGAIAYVDMNGVTVIEDFLAGETRMLASKGIIDATTTVTKVSGMR